jgi:hypothetical protein
LDRRRIRDDEAEADEASSASLASTACPFAVPRTEDGEAAAEDAEREEAAVLLLLLPRPGRIVMHQIAN